MANGNADDRWCECGHLESDHAVSGYCGACTEEDLTDLDMMGDRCGCTKFRPAANQED